MIAISVVIKKGHVVCWHSAQWHWQSMSGEEEVREVTLDNVHSFSTFELRREFERREMTLPEGIVNQQGLMKLMITRLVAEQKQKERDDFERMEKEGADLRERLAREKEARKADAYERQRVRREAEAAAKAKAEEDAAEQPDPEPERDEWEPWESKDTTDGERLAAVRTRAVVRESVVA